MTSKTEPMRLVVPVWGVKHVQRFLEVALPSWLADNNLPFVARTRGLSVFMVTRDEDVAAIKASPAFAVLEQICPVSFHPLDDLLASVSTYVTLTLAFHRGLAAAVPEGETGLVVFLNGDFVLADGSLKTLSERLEDGAKAVLAPSLRGNEEDLAGVLEAAKQSPAVLSLPPRDLVAATFRALHPTVVCARMDQRLVRSMGAHQYFWRPEPQTLVARGFCLFPLAMRIEGPVRAAESFCDYGMVPLQIGSDEALILSDSDAFFCLELTAFAHELEFFQPGAPGAEFAASRIGEWSTSFHRKQAATPLYFRTGTPGARVQEALADSAAFVDEVLVRLPKPLPSALHPHWVGAVKSWRDDRRSRGRGETPPELKEIPAELPRPEPGPVRRAAREFLVGAPGRLRFWHPYWRLARVLGQEIRRTAQGGVRVQSVGTHVVADLWSLSDATRLDPQAQEVWIGLSAGRPDTLSALRASAEPALRACDQALVVLRAEAGAAVDPASFAATVSWLDSATELSSIEPIDLGRDYRSLLAHGHMADRFTGASPLGRLGMVARSACALAAITFSNLAWTVLRGRRRTQLASAVIIRARGTAAAARARASAVKDPARAPDRQSQLARVEDFR